MGSLFDNMIAYLLGPCRLGLHGVCVYVYLLAQVLLSHIHFGSRQAQFLLNLLEISTLIYKK